MAQWRKENPEKHKEYATKSQNLHRDKYNLTRKEKYHTDEDYRNTRKKQGEKYNKSGRRAELRKLPGRAEKARQKSKEYHANNSEKNSIYNKKYRAEHPELMKELRSKRVETLPDEYVVALLIKQCPFLTREDIPANMIKTRRLIIKLRRHGKNKKSTKI